MQQDKFAFHRSRGIVLVCDLADSTKQLNSETTAAVLEDFLPRLHWISRVVVDAAGGVFVKWTGDGFLAWFETPLMRELPRIARSLFEAVWHLTVAVNVTQLGTTPAKKFILKYGVAFEHDALVTTIAHSGGHTTFDITGRAVVLAFRLSSVRAEFPGFASDAIVVNAAKEGGFPLSFKSWRPNSEELLRYFKGERWGTSKLVVSVDMGTKKHSINATIRTSKKLIAKIEEDPKEIRPVDGFSLRYLASLEQGPVWARKVIKEETQVFKQMLRILKTTTGLFDSNIQDQPQ